MSQGTSQVPVIPRNQFMLEEVPIGRGGFGTVFRGQHTKLGMVAVKTLIDSGMLPKKHLMALQREAEKLRGVCQHPSILNLHGIITEKNNYSLVLEYMPLGSATEYRKDFTVQWPLIVQIIRDIIDGMTFLHEHNPTILHLDLKGDNILLDNLCRAKLSDFGLSEWKTITMTVTRGEGGGQSSSRKCTVTHVPPEVWSNVNLPSDKYYDIYSFGIVIWELLSGQFPYKMASEELIRSAVLSGQRPDFVQIPKDCPMFLTKMMTRCWHQKPTQRPHFKDLQPEIKDEFEKNHKKYVVKSLKSLRREIMQMYPSTDPMYFLTNEIDKMVEPVVPVPSTSAPSQGSTTIPKVVESAPTPENQQQEAPKEETRQFPKFLSKKNDDLSNEDKEVRKVLFSPTACRLLKTRYFKDIFKVTEETRQILINPASRKQYIESDETLARQVKYSKCNAMNQLNGEYYDFRTSVGKQWGLAVKRDMDNQQRESYYKNKAYSSMYSDQLTERGKKHRRATDSLEKNPAMKKLKTGGAYYKVKKIIENPEVLKQALQDKEKGVSSALRLVAIDTESLDLLQNPFLLMMVFGSEYDTRRKYCDEPTQHRGLFMQLFGNATFKSSFPSGGYKLPADMVDLVPRWLEAEMVKEGFDIDRINQMQDASRRRKKYNYGMFPDSDDEDYDGYSPMRHLSRRMMDVNVRPGSNMLERLDGYHLRKIVGEVEQAADKTDLAKKVIRILSRPPPEERAEMRRKEMERRSAGMSSPNSSMPPMRGSDPLEMMMMMGMDPSRMDEKMLMKTVMRMEQKKMKEMRDAQRKAQKSSTGPSASATKSKPDIETDASGSMPSEKSVGDQGQTNPSVPKKSKSEVKPDAKASKDEPSVSTNKDGSIEIEHKSAGMLGGITKLLFGKNAKVPNMQVGNRNMMHIGHHNDDSDDEDMPDSSYDKNYKPPSNERAPTKSELDRICSRIHGDYRNLGRQLNVPYNTVEQCVEDYRQESMHEVSYQIIKKWQQLNGSAATNVVLSNALHKMRRDDLSKYLRL